MQVAEYSVIRDGNVISGTQPYDIKRWNVFQSYFIFNLDYIYVEISGQDCSDIVTNIS